MSEQELDSVDFEFDLTREVQSNFSGLLTFNAYLLKSQKMDFKHLTYDLFLF